MHELLRVLARGLRHVEFFFPHWIEQFLVRSENSYQASTPLVAIVGPPRVGSTLMYQCLTSCYETFYFDNIQHALLRYPYLGFLCSNLLPRRTGEKEGFRSDHGFSSGFRSVSEANFFWPRWLDMSMEQKEPQPYPKRVRHIFRVLNRIQQRTGVPMVTSYNAHTFYLEQLQQLFEKVVFVVMSRDLVDNAVSLLRARRKLSRQEGEWWSIKPRRCSELASQGESPHEQIRCQILESYRVIARSRKNLDADLFVDVSYEELCSDPATTLAYVERACSRCGIELRPRHRPPLEPFSRCGRRPGEKFEIKRFEGLFSPYLDSGQNALDSLN